jgi:hypothetical protein
LKTIARWDDLIPYGIDPLTGEACGLGYRILCDLTDQGRVILEKCLGAATVVPHLQWNSGTKEHPHTGSIMLAPEMLPAVAVFALLESGCKEVWRTKEGTHLGIEATDPPEQIAMVQSAYGPMRRFAYKGTAGDRNVHVMSGRVE